MVEIKSQTDHIALEGFIPLWPLWPRMECPHWLPGARKSHRSAGTEAEISEELQWFISEYGVGKWKEGEAVVNKDCWWLETTGASSVAMLSLRENYHSQTRGLIISYLPPVKGVVSLPLPKVVHADHIFLGSNPAALRMATWRGVGGARCLVPSQHHGQNRFKVLAEAVTGEGVEDWGEATMGEGQALCHLQHIVQTVADLTVPKDMQIQQRVQEQGEVVREPQQEEDYHQGRSHPQSPALSRWPQPDQNTTDAGVKENHGQQWEEKPQEVQLESQVQLPNGCMSAKIGIAVPHAI